ncbi:MAG: hypothetical protein LBG05_00645 [Treponema sp.]|jgi:O-glycosyl hydrolase|nr:hypothetical protein [Treponema sp.]
MKKTKWFLCGLLSMALVFGFILANCTGGSNGEDTPINDDPLGSLSAATPIISLQPVSTDYVVGDTVAPLTVAVAVADSGVLSYQWYSNTSFSAKNGTEIANATASSYTPFATAATAGETFYYVVATNTNENAERNKTTTVTSSPVRIRVSATALAPPSKSLTIDPATRYQYVRGFGGMSSVVFRAGTGGSSPDIMLEDIDKMFNPNGELRFNMLRITLYDDLDGVIGNKFPGGNGVWQDNSDYYDIVKRVNLYGGYVFACPWTPPAYFKTNNSLVGGGHVKPELYHEYAEYLRSYLKRMNDHGAPLYAISIQNEPNFTAAYEGCEWTDQEQSNFFIQEGHFTDGIPGYGGGRAYDSVRTMTGESANTPTINNITLTTPESRRNVDIVPRHYYGNIQGAYPLAIEGIDGDGQDLKEVWQTEHSDSTGASSSIYPELSTWNRVWALMNEVDCSQRLNQESAFVWWYTKRFYGFISDGQYGAPAEHTILPRGYALAHYSRFAADTTRVGISTSGIAENTEINNTTYGQYSTVPKATAYESMDGKSLSLIIWTPTQANGTGGVNLGDIQINLPWEASSAYALASDVDKKLADEVIVLSADKRSAIITVPASTIISVKFIKSE